MKHCDPKAISEHLAGDEELIEELGELFIATYPSVMLELKEAIEQVNYSEIERAAHTLKGMVANFFAAEIKQICFEMETMGQEKKIEGIKDKLVQAELNINELIEEIKCL